MKTFSVNIDERVDKTLEELRRSFGKSSKAEVFRTALALLKVADEARAKGLKLTISDRDDRVQKEIVLGG
jgi:hypothetical protein